MLSSRRAILHTLTAAGVAGAIALPSSSTATPGPALAAFALPSGPSDTIAVLHQDRVAQQQHRVAVQARATAAAAKAAAAKAAAVRAAAARQQALAEAREDRQRDAARASRTRRAAASAPTGSPKAYARSLLAARGMSDQYSCLNSLWNRESGWSVTARNASSGAYGIPQALPATKMASEGADYRTNGRTQVRWGVNYIQSRYGGPCAAWSHSQSNGWY